MRKAVPLAGALSIVALLTSPAARAQGPAERGPLLRATAEYSSAHYGYGHDGSFAGEGAATRFSLREATTASAWGGRFEGGVVIGNGRGFAFVPRGSLTVAKLGSETVRVDVAGLEHRWTSEPWWLGGAAGVELQTFERMFCLSGELGIAGVRGGSLTQVSPAGLDARAEPTFGGVARVGLGLRLPSEGSLGGGLTASAEAFWNPFVAFSEAPLGTGTRLALGVFVEWDGGRQP